MESKLKVFGHPVHRMLIAFPLEGVMDLGQPIVRLGL